MKCLEVLKGPLGILFFTHSISSWGDRMWWFAGGIFMKDLAGFAHESLLFVGVYTFMLSGIVLAFGAVLGRWIDNTPRLKAIQVVLVMQNTLLIICAATVVMMFIQWEFILRDSNGALLRLLQAFVICTASLSQLASTGTQIIIQKDWIIIICDGDMDLLANVNTIIRTIDLSTQVFAPLVVGFVRQQAPKLYTAVLIGAWNLLSMIVEYYMFYLVYKRVPKLKEEKQKMQHLDSCSEKYADHSVCPTEYTPQCCFCCQACKYDWKTYFSHTICFAGLALACLYMTVLGFDAVTTAYSDTQISTGLVAATQGGAALMGVFGSASFPTLRKCIQQETIALIGISLEVCALTLCVASVWASGSPFKSSSLAIINNPFYDDIDQIRNPEAEAEYVEDHTAMIFLCVGIILSRYGLWLTDITITQVMQERIEERKRGTINGVQDSLNMAMDMVKSALVIVFPRPEQFGLLIVLSFCAVCFGLLNYIIFHWQIKSLPSTPPASANEEAQLNTSQTSTEARAANNTQNWPRIESSKSLQRIRSLQKI